MNTVQRIVKNTTVLFISQFITYIFGFFASMYTARYLGADGFGIISLAFALAGIFGVFMDLGLGSITVREVAREKSLRGKYTANTASIKLILCFLTFGLVALTVNLIGYSEVVINVIYLVTVSTIFGAFSGIFSSIFTANEKMEYISIGTILNSILTFTGVILAIYYKLDILAFASIYLIISVVNLVYFIIVYSWKFSLPKLDVDLAFWKLTLKEASPLALAIFFALIHFRVDTIILSIIKGNFDVGIYNAAYKLMETLTFIPIIFTTSIYPVLSRFHISSKESLKLTYKLSFKYLIILGLPIAVGTTLLADEIILLIFKSGFTLSILALKILVWALPLIFMGYLFGTLIPSINKQHLLYRFMFICMSTNIILNLILVPKLSYIGTSIVTVITEIIYFILCFHYISKFIGKINIKKVILKPLTASLVMGLFIYSVKILNVNLLVVIIISMILYFLVLILLKTFSKDEFKLIKQIIG